MALAWLASTGAVGATTVRAPACFITLFVFVYHCTYDEERMERFSYTVKDIRLLYACIRKSTE